jgi:hypothetical protein
VDNNDKWTCIQDVRPICLLSTQLHCIINGWEGLGRTGSLLQDTCLEELSPRAPHRLLRMSWLLKGRSMYRLILESVEYCNLHCMTGQPSSLYSVASALSSCLPLLHIIEEDWVVAVLSRVIKRSCQFLGKAFRKFIVWKRLRFMSIFLLIKILNRIWSEEEKEASLEPTIEYRRKSGVWMSGLAGPWQKILWGGLLKPALVVLPGEKKSVCVFKGPLSSSSYGRPTQLS